MDHDRVSNILFGCAVALGFESFILIKKNIPYGALVTSCVAILVLWQSWIVFNSKEK